MPAFHCLKNPTGLPYSSGSSRWLGGERMPDLLRNVHVQLALSTSLLLTSCHTPTACDPPGATAGTYVHAKNSEAYLAEMNKVGGDVEHVACRAESNIEIQIQYLRNNEVAGFNPKQYGGTGAESRASTTPYDPRVMIQRENIGRYGGKYRVLGLGRGMSEDDCGKMAVAACDEAI